MSKKNTQEKPKTLSRLLKYIGAQKFWIITVFIITLVATAFNVNGPKVMGQATTEIFNGFMSPSGINFDKVWQVILICVAIYVVNAVLSLISALIMAKTTQKIVFKLREDTEDKINRLPLSYFDSRNVGDILSVVTNDIDQIQTTLQQSITQMISSVATVIGIIIMMITISIPLTLFALVSVPLIGFLASIIMKKSQNLFSRQQQKIADVNSHIEEMYSAHHIIKAYNKEEESVTKFEEKNDALYDSAWKAQFMSGILMPVANFVNNLQYVAIVVFGTISVINKGIQIGDLQAFISYTRQIQQPIGQIANVVNQFQLAIAGAQRVFDLLDSSDDIPDSIEAKLLENVEGNIEFKNVKFGYSKEKEIIHDFSLDVKAGETIAIVGPTGAGKTTIINLLMRFYEINKGSILIDGVDYKQTFKEDLRVNYGMVLQDAWLYNDTVFNNIKYSKDDATKEEIEAACKLVKADEFITKLPKGYDTVLNEDLTNISQGQRQLLTIARAVLADPKILILDEATSNIDSRTEILIQDAMNKLMVGRTSFVIAHRLSTIKNADKILVLDQGDIIEIGNHEELLEHKGFYYNLYNSQFA